MKRQNCDSNSVCLIACSHRRHGQDIIVLSCLVLVGGVNTAGDKTRQFSLVLTQFQFATVQSQIYWGLLKTWKLPNCINTVLSWPCRRCEQAVIMHAKNWTESFLLVPHKTKTYHNNHVQKW